MYRFAKIVYLDIETSTVHIHWLEHGSQTFLEELAHPQELFYNDTCTSIPFELIVGKVNVHEVIRGQPKPTLQPEEYFVK